MATGLSFLSEGRGVQMDPKTKYNVNQGANTPEFRNIKEISEISNQQANIKQSSIAFEIIKTYSDHVIGRQVEILYGKEMGIFARVISSDNRITQVSKEWISGIPKEMTTYPQKIKVFLENTYVTLGYVSDMGYHIYLNPQLRGGKIEREVQVDTQDLNGMTYTGYLTKSWEEVSIHDKGIAYIIHWAKTNGYEILCADPARTKFVVEAPSCKCYETCKTDDRVKHIAKESGYRPDLILRKSNSRDIIIEVERTKEKNTRHSKEQIGSLSEYQARFSAKTEFWVIWVT